MKNALLIGFLFLLPALAIGQSPALNKFYRKHKKGSDIQNIKVPGWLIRFGGKIAKKHADSEEDKMAMDLLKKFGTVRFIYSEDGSKIPANEIKKLQENLRKEQFDDLIMIRSGQMDFKLMIREEDGVISELFMLYNDREEGELAFISAKTRIHLDDLKRLLKKGVNEKLQPYFDIEEEPEDMEPIL